VGPSSREFVGDAREELVSFVDEGDGRDDAVGWIEELEEGKDLEGEGADPSLDMNLAELEGELLDREGMIRGRKRSQGGVDLRRGDEGEALDLIEGEAGFDLGGGSFSLGISR